MSVLKEYINTNTMDSYYSCIIRKMALEHYAPEVVIALSRGGLDFGVKISHYFDIPMVPLQWQTRDGNHTDSYELRTTLNAYSNHNVLIVDDICDTGVTFAQVLEVVQRGAGSSSVDFACAICNTDLQHVPRWRAREINRTVDKQWFVFPWESWWSSL